MKKLLIIAFVLASTVGVAQQETGMHFEHGSTWAAIQTKAKAENKYIFVDAFTTWCGPCKAMAKNIFPLPEVGDFYNAKYINVKVQLDSTGKDNEEVKGWYKDAHDIMVKYKVNVFPTYLIFSPNGEIVHRAVGSSEAPEFIAVGKAGIDPNKQYYTLKKKYQSGNKDNALLLSLVTAAQSAYDQDFIPMITKEYLATQTDLTTPDNIKLLAQSTEKTTDPGFKVFLDNAKKADEILGQEGASESIVKKVLTKEIVTPVAFGKKGVEPDWVAVKEKLKDYPQFADEIVYTTQAKYYRSKKEWPKFKDAVTGYISVAGSKVSSNELNSFAWTIFENCDDGKCIEEALVWSKKSLAGVQEPALMDTYANLLYKSGKKDEGIKVEQKAIEISRANKEDATELEATLEKMKKGEKTW